MRKTHTYATTYEQTREDGTVIASAEVRIHYAIDRNAHPPIIPGMGHPSWEAGVEFDRAEVEDGKGGYEPACETVTEWARWLTEDDPARFIDSAA